MNQRISNLFPYIILSVLLAALAWAVSFGRLPPAEMTFCNGDEIKSLDPAVTSTDNEGKVVRGLYEGLCQWDPKTLEAIPGCADDANLSDVLHKLDQMSLSHLIGDHEAGYLEQICRA